MSRSGGVADARRSVRFWASAALALLIAAAVIQLDVPGPGLMLAGVAAAAALWPVLRHPRPAGTSPDRASKLNASARLVLLAGLAIVGAAFAVSHTGEQRARMASLCDGQSADMGHWKFDLTDIVPVGGHGFTALQASIAAQRSNAPPVMLKPQLRFYFMPAPNDGAPGRAQLWDGDLALHFAGYDASKGCIELTFAWRPFAGLARLAGWLAALGAALMAVVALGSIRWRSNARKRIAMRREDRPLPGSSPARAGKPAMWPIGKVLIACLIVGLAGTLALIWAAGQPRTAAPVLPGFKGGAAMVAARQSLRETKTIPSSWIVIADAMARRGRFSDAAAVLLGAVENAPNNPEAWLALGDALYAHGSGRLSPAAAFAYDRADAATIRAGNVPVLVVMAFERSGRGPLAADWLERRLKDLPGASPWRAELEQRLGEAQSSQPGIHGKTPTP